MINYREIFLSFTFCDSLVIVGTKLFIFVFKFIFFASTFRNYFFSFTMSTILESLVRLSFPRKLDSHPNRLLEYDLEEDLINLYLISFRLPTIEIISSRRIINILYVIVCWINAFKISSFYFLDVPMAKRFGDVSLSYGESRYYGLAYNVIGFLYICTAYSIVHFGESHPKSYLWLGNYNQIYPNSHFFVSPLAFPRWTGVKKQIQATYYYLWVFTRFLIIPSVALSFFFPIFVVERSVDLLTSLPSAILGFWCAFYAYNLVRVSVFLGISYGLIMHFSSELNLIHLRKLYIANNIPYSQIQRFFRHYLYLYNEAFEANKFMSKLSGILYCGTFLESLVCIYVSFIAHSPLSTRLLFIGFFNVHVTLNIVFMSLAFIYPQRLDQLIRNTIHKLLKRPILSPLVKIQLEEALFMMESYPMGWRCFHFFRFSSSSLLLTLIEIGAHMLLIVLSVPRVTH